MVRGRVILAVALAAAVPALAAAPSLNVEIGKNLFDRPWVSAPASAKSADGLGPLLDGSSCAACHVDLASGLELVGDSFPRIIVRLGNEAGTGDPVYGRQLQLLTARGLQPEVLPAFSWRQDGALRIPVLTFHELGYGPLAPSTRFALRRSSALDGIGLLARIPEREILQLADPDDANADGISGRPAWLDDGKGGGALGRFGWRAAQATLVSQTEAAFSNDIGMSTTGHPDPWGDCTPAQTACRAAPHGAGPGEVEISDALRDRIVDFLAADDRMPPPSEGRGGVIFESMGCGACHANPRLADGTQVFAFSDLLLHDMGPGLNDGIKEGAAEPGEWRTAPLRGMAVMLRGGGVLHDGRARNVAEAVEWHGGEGAGARTRFRALSDADKAALLAFVNGL